MGQIAVNRDGCSYRQLIDRHSKEFQSRASVEKERANRQTFQKHPNELSLHPVERSSAGPQSNSMPQWLSAVYRQTHNRPRR